MLVASVAVCLGASATDYYVDAENGVDDAAHTGATPALAKKTLAAAMGITGLKSGDTVWAAAGTYKDGTMQGDDVGNNMSTVVYADVLSRVIIPAGVTLRSVEGPEKTIILGEADTTAPVWNGCGPNSVRCATLKNSKSRLIGFTLTGGHARMDSATSGTEGGAVRQYIGTYGDVSTCSHVIGCIISNNFAYIAGAGFYGSFDSCHVVNNTAKSTTSAIGGSLRNFLFDCYVNGNTGGSFQVQETCECNGVTFGPDGDRAFKGRSDSGGHCKNCVFLNTFDSYANKTYKRCFFSTAFDLPSAGGYDSDCERHAPSDFKLDATGRPMTGSCLIDAGSNTYHSATYTDDSFGVPRVLNARIDVGAYEHDWRINFAAALDPLGDVSVTNCSADVTLGADGRTVRLAPDTTADISWKTPFVDETDFRFHVRVTGTGTLKVYANGADSPSYSVTKLDGDRQIDVMNSGALGLVFVYEKGTDDDGGAELWDFTNAGCASIAVSNAGVTLTGANTGKNLVTPGQTLVFSLQRTFDSAATYSTGVLSNGVFYAFDDFVDGRMSFSVSGALRNNLDIEVQYANVDPTVWYVDAEGGNDGNYGRHAKNAFKTLKTAAEVAQGGDTVWALPGTYKDGTMPANDMNDSRQAVTMSNVLNRVIIPDGVTFRSVEGPEKTVILGADATEPIENMDGCGTDSVRCVTMGGKGSRLIGFTLTGGRARMNSASVGTTGGGVRQYVGTWSDFSTYSHVVDCIISNNVAMQNGGGVYGVYEGCRIIGNRCKDTQLATTFRSSGIGGSIRNYLFDCYVNGNEGGVQVTETLGCRGVTFGPDGGPSFKSRADTGGTYWNCAVLSAAETYFQNDKYHRCFFLTGIPTDGNSDADCEQHTLAEFGLDATGRPTKDSCLVDAGSNTYHTTAFASDFYGVPRLLNRRVDIGAYEHDWRIDYARDLGGRLQVPTATSYVVETADSAVRLTDGQELTVKFADEEHARLGLAFPFAVSGGTLTVTVNGTVVRTAETDGSWKYNGTADDVIEFSFVADEPTGYADLLKTMGGFGLMFIFR